MLFTSYKRGREKGMAHKGKKRVKIFTDQAKPKGRKKGGIPTSVMRAQ